MTAKHVWTALLLLGISSALFAANRGLEDREREKLANWKREAAEWLLEQKVPNGRIDDPVPGRRNLLISYRVPEDDPAYPYLKGRSYLYDDALAVIALTMRGRLGEAEELLFALSRQLRDDGSLWFGMNVHNSWPSEESNQGATIRSGASAWAGYAATFYLRARQDEDPDFSTDGRIARRILLFAEKTARHLLSLQVTDKEDPRYGLVTGGMGSYELEVVENGEVRSRYSEERIGWVSAEHNIDIYFLFSDLARLTGGSRYRRAAKMVEEGLLSMWDEDAGQFIQGIKQDGRRDSVLPLDTASWGAMFLRAAGHGEKAERALAAAVERFQIGDSGTYRPYDEDEVYLNDEVSRVYFDAPDILWSELDIAWPEGALGVATACAQSGRAEEALTIIRANQAYSEGGGLVYASMEVPHQFSTYPSAASTAWLIIAAETLTDERDRTLFWRGLGERK